MISETDNKQNMTLTIAGRNYTFKCAPQDTARLEEVAYILNSEIAALTETHVFNDREKLLVLAAFKACCKLRSESTPEEYSLLSQASARIDKLEQRLAKFCSQMIDE